MEWKYKMGYAEIFAPNNGKAEIEWKVDQDGIEDGTELILKIFNNETDATGVEIEKRLKKEEIDQLIIALSDLRNKLK